MGRTNPAIGWFMLSEADRDSAHRFLSRARELFRHRSSVGVAPHGNEAFESAFQRLAARCPDATAPSQEALRSSAGVILLTGLLAGMAAATATAWLALAPLDSWFRRGGLALVSAFGTVLAMLVLVPVDQAFGPPGLAAMALLLLSAAAWLGYRFRRAEI